MRIIAASPVIFLIAGGLTGWRARNCGRRIRVLGEALPSPSSETGPCRKTSRVASKASCGR